ncbi:hypothetical protein V2I01_30375 [Micromonospora sp. BRA006-A]|nr:hypothetical protein [Micromonospora sp. BRA006-A]
MAGLLRVAQAEQPDRFLLLSLDTTDDAAIRSALAAADDEPEVAVRGGRALLPRLRPVERPRPARRSRPWPAAPCSSPAAPAGSAGTSPPTSPPRTASPNWCWSAAAAGPATGRPR